MTLGSTALGSSYRLAGRPDIQVVVSNVGLACCSLEIDAAVQRGLLVAATAEDDAARTRTVLILSGTVTEALGPAVARAFGALPPPVSVLAFGACACTAGPYWDAPTVVKGADELVPVDSYVPGCPPRPEALVAAIAGLVSRVLP